MQVGKNDKISVILVMNKSQIVMYKVNDIHYLQFNGYPIGTNSEREYFNMGYQEVLNILRTEPQSIITDNKRIECQFLVYNLGDKIPMLHFKLTNDKDWAEQYIKCDDCVAYISFSTGITCERLIATSRVKTPAGYMHPAQSFTLSESDQKLIQ